MFKLLLFCLLTVFVRGIYIPENGDDWTTLKPEELGDGIQTVPFKFGIVVTLADDCDSEKPALSGIDTYQHDDGQVQRRPFEEGEQEIEAVEDHQFSIKAISCMTSSTLVMSLTGGILRDSNNRIGSIVENGQFQFDGPTPQHGTIYANGWSINQEGNLMLGDQGTFYQCASGDFYNLYDRKIDEECDEVNMTVVGLIDC